MLVKAAPGLVLRDPETRQRIPDEGVHVDDHSPLWNRMLADGDVVRVDEAKPDLEPETAAEPHADPEREPAPEPQLEHDVAAEPVAEPAPVEEHA